MGTKTLNFLYKIHYDMNGYMFTASAIFAIVVILILVFLHHQESLPMEEKPTEPDKSYEQAAEISETKTIDKNIT